MNDKQLTPEEIIEKQFYDASHEDIGNNNSTMITTEIAISIHKQQAAALRARVQELEEKYQAAHEMAADSIVRNSNFQSRIAELERELGYRKRDIYVLQKEKEESKQYAETLMGLLKDEIVNGGHDWQSYCKEHGLQSPENPAP